MKKENRLLIIRFSAMGDVAMLVPVVSSLASQRPELKITVLSQEFARPLFRNMPANVSFFGADVRKDYKGVGGLVRLYKELKALRPTAVADMHDVLRTKFLRLLFGMTSMAKVRHIDKHRAGKKALCRPEGKILEQQPSTFANYCDVLAALGFYIRLNFTSVINNPENIKKNPDAIGIAPFAAHKGKIYPLEKMEKVMRLLIAKGKKIYLFGGGKSEMAQFHQWQAELGYEKVLIVGEFIKRDLMAEIELMATLGTMVSMDSANQHLASLAGTRVVSIWGATHPLAGFMAYGQKETDCVQCDLPCRPCSVYGNKPCAVGGYPCLNNIEPETIVARVLN